MKYFLFVGELSRDTLTVFAETAKDARTIAQALLEEKPVLVGAFKTNEAAGMAQDTLERRCSLRIM